MVAPISRLYVHAPMAPRSGREDLGEYGLDAQFSWYCDGPNAQQGIGAIRDMPYADEAYVLIPTIDVRFITLVVPLVSRKKLQTILPTLLEEHLLSTQELATIVLAPRAGQVANQRIVAAMDRSWHEWLVQQINQLLAPQVSVLADCFVLPVPTAKDPVQEFRYSPRGVALSMQVRRTGAQTGVAFLEQGAPSTPAQLQWDWSWVGRHAFDEAALQTNLMNHRPNHASNSKTRVHGSWAVFIRQVLIRLNLTLGIGLAACLVYAVTLYGLDWKWQSDMTRIASKAVQGLSATNPAGGSDRAEDSIQTLMAAAIRSAHRQGQLSNSDFVSLASQLQQLRAQLPADAIAQIEYQEGHLMIQMRPGIDAARAIAKAKELGMVLTLLGPQQFQLFANAGLGSVAVSNLRSAR